MNRNDEPTRKKSKEVELIGDKLLDLILVEEFINLGGNYRKANLQVQPFTTNVHLYKIAENLGLKPEDTSLVYEKAMANAYEKKIGDIYLKLGIEACRDFILKTIEFAPVLKNK